MLAGLTQRARAGALRGTKASLARAWREGRASLTLAWRESGWEKWAYIAIIAVALGTRLWDLGGRSLHYDEILHAYYSWQFAQGFGYSHTPVTHGPFLFHATAAAFALVGSSEVTARLLPALFGTVLVGLPYFLRRELGRYGALAAAVLLTVSPSMLYFGRFIRNDIFMAVWALSLLIVMWRYMERPRTALLIVWTVLWAFALTTKESSYLTVGSFGLFLLVLAAPPIWRWVRGLGRLSDMTPAGDLLIVLGTLSLPLLTPAVGLLQGLVGVTLVNPDANDPRIASGEIVRAATETGAPAGGGLYIAAFVVAVAVAISVSVGMRWDRRRWPLLAAIFVGIWLTLFTSVFSNWQGFFTGFWGSLGYWIAQQGVERAGQPWYYYLIGLSVYEFVTVVPAVAGGVYLAVRGRRFDRLVVGWAALTMAVFTLAGERMPWLLVGITLPLTLVAGRSIGMLAESALRSRYASAGFVGGAGLAVLGPLALVRAIRADELTSDVGFWLAVAGSGAVLAAALVVALRLRPAPALVAATRFLGVLQQPHVRPTLSGAALGVLAVLLGMTLFVGGRATYGYAGFERPTELLVYSQSGQETSYAAECIDRIARESGKGREGLRVFSGESDNFAWQWRWYLRDYNVEYRFLHETPLTEPPDADVVLISQSVEASNREQLTGFTRVGEIHHLWWFPNAAYAGLTPTGVLRAAFTKESWRTVTDYFFTRQLTREMYKSNGLVYVANDLAEHAYVSDDRAVLARECDFQRAAEGL